MSTQALSEPDLTLTTTIGWPGAAWVSELSLGNRIAELRKERGLTQKELAERLGVTQPVVSDYENDIIRLPADVAVALARILAVSTDALLGLKSETRTPRGAKNRRLSRRLQAIDALPKRDQEALLRTIDAFIAKTG
jgi:transcriptional regulator with XRE-family HTH domain